MTDREMLEQMLAKVTGIENNFNGIENRLNGIENRLNELDLKLTETRLHIENATDKNIQLIAENFIELTKKLNQAIPVADKNLAYEVKVNYLIEEVNKLKKELSELKSKIA